MADIIDNMESQTKFDRTGKGGNKCQHFGNIIEVHDNVDDSGVKSKLASKPLEPPHLVLFKKEGQLKGVYIIGDAVSIQCQGTSVISAVTQLLATHYVFDIDYPKCYAMLLGFLQTFVLKEPFSYETSKKYKFFVRKFRPVFDSIKIEN